ncbi:hypothetical protein [Virgibacillus halodenitrificans]|uniref:hypothetical protein n=1 Tax=Virgibacillus halodenitrificans TaxID=1482 RepID=UPI0013CEAE5D|nr:hypothetical protein [Virgibacillus halodenitrificans]
MKTLTLNDIESRVVKNSIQYNDTNKQIISQIKSKNLNQGRVRPKNSTEEKILAKFSRS